MSHLHAVIVLSQLTYQLNYRSHFSPERISGKPFLFLQRAFPTSRLRMVLMALEGLLSLTAQALLASLPHV